MKNKLKLVGVIVCLIAGICFWTNQKNELPALILENIEALAYGENGNGANCYGDGSIDCAGDWVEVKISGLSLE
mgnify:CR=1 FL=1